VEERIALGIAQTLGVPEIIGRVLAGRGVGMEAAEAYLHPSLKSDLPDPSVLKDMEIAAARAAGAIIGGEKVAVFGDYDVDGATSSALLYRFFAAAGAGLEIYIPDRIAEGYGPNLPALLKLKDKGCGLVITVDCGTMAFAPLASGRAAGLDIIVLDHHQAEPALPEVLALVNPNRLDDTSGLGQLAAAGVTFLFVVALNRELRARGWYHAGRPEPDLMQWLDLVALGTICDVVPLTGVNRVLVTQGLKVMALRRNPGLAALGDVGRLSEPPGTYHAGFIFGPRVNAGGRVGNAALGARILTTDDADEARRLAEELDGYNKERQAIELEVQAAALRQIGDLDAAEPVVFAAGEGWHPGVIGIVAGRLKEKFGRPAIVIALEGGTGKGSGRSVPGVDLGAAVTAAKQAGILVNGGGHSMAAGLTVETAKLDDLRVFLRARLANAPEGERALKLDGEVSALGVTPELVKILEQAGPYGQGNPQPRFAIAGVTLSYVDVVGGAHVKCAFTAPGGGRFNGIAFRKLGEPLGEALLAGKGRRMHIAGSLKVNAWRGEAKAEIFIDDIAYA
jgi:single-stranded-DNA-specific exonuclease